MKILLLGRGKTGNLVAEIARQRNHELQIAGAAENAAGAALSKEKLHDIDVVIDFTTPHCIIANIEACVAAGRNMIVGTTGWYDELDRVRELVEKNNTGLVYAANFSVGVNLLYEVAQVAAAALRHNYTGQIFERHHVHKKDAPSGTALAIQEIIRKASDKNETVEITSFREGEVVGMHEVIFESPNDTIYLCHDATSRQGFAEGAVRAAEWVATHQGFHNFKDIWRSL
jgi:4-hydroxy-tetrahydrodipicolinate reductase